MNLNENIHRIKEVMGLNEGLSDITGTPIYHNTFPSRAIQIMKSDSLIGTKPFDELLDLDPTLKNTKYQRMISFTRDRNFIPDQSIGVSNSGPNGAEMLDVIFVVDLDKLKTRYKVVPFDYSSLDKEFVRVSKNKELEERVLTDVIYPLRPYVIDIIYKGDDVNVMAIIKEYLGR